MWAIIPLKSLERTKQRLGSTLSLEQRKQLTTAILLDQLEVLKNITRIEKILLLSRDPACSQLALEHNIQCLSLEADTNLNSGLTACLDYCSEQGATQVIIIHADIPLLDEAALNTAIDDHQQSVGITFVPSNKKDGTNLLLADLPLAIKLEYGENSFHKHCQAALKAGVRVRIHENPLLGLDIDTDSEFSMLLKANDTKTHCRAFIENFPHQARPFRAAHS